MKLKNVLQGLCRHYQLEELSIIEMEKEIVHFSGTPSQWKGTTVDLLWKKKDLENREVQQKLIFNNSKAYIFV